MPIKTSSLQETARVATLFAQKLRGGELVALVGDLGAGKTTFVRGVAQALGSPVRVKSPTFTVMNEYPVHHGNIRRIIHVDFYRFTDPAHIEGIALDDALDGDTVVFVEWPDIFKKTVLHPQYEVRFTHIDETTREIDIVRL